MAYPGFRQGSTRSQRYGPSRRRGLPIVTAYMDRAGEKHSFRYSFTSVFISVFRYSCVVYLLYQTFWPIDVSTFRNLKTPDLVFGFLDFYL